MGGGLLIGLLNEFEDLFDDTLGKGGTKSIHLDLTPESNEFNGR